MLVMMTQNWSILAKFPVKSADFSKNLPLKILRKLTFSAKIPRNRLIFLQILTFLPRKSREIGRLFREFWLFSRENQPIFPRICPWKSREILLFFPRNIRSPVYKIIILILQEIWCCSLLGLKGLKHHSGKSNIN